MKFAKRLLMVAGAVALAGIVGAMIDPKGAHALVTALVTVANTSANPVPSVATDNPALQPFQTGGIVSGSTLIFSFAVPSKTLAIEQLNVLCTVPTGSFNPVDIRVSVKSAGTFAQYAFAPAAVGGSELVWSEEMHVYADADSAINIGSGFSLPDNANCGAAISGHLVNPL